MKAIRATLILLAAGSGMRAAEPDAFRQAEAKFPYTVTITTADSKWNFPPGDGIRITRVRGDRPEIHTGGTYLFEGDFMLHSAPNAELALFPKENRRPGWQAPILQVHQGTGHFALIAKLPSNHGMWIALQAPQGNGQPLKQLGAVLVQGQHRQDMASSSTLEYENWPRPDYVDHR